MYKRLFSTVGFMSKDVDMYIQHVKKTFWYSFISVSNTVSFKETETFFSKFAEIQKFGFVFD